MGFDKEAIEKEILTELSECVSEFRDDMNHHDDFVLLEKTIVKLRDLLNHKKIPYNYFRS